MDAADRVSPAAVEVAAPLAGLRGRWLQWRDRLLASPGFRRWASRFPLTRPTARRHARELFDLVAGFVYSQVLLACVRLKLFDMLAEGPQSRSMLAARLGLPEEATQTLLAAAVSLKLVETRRGGLYGLGPLGAPMVGNTAIAAMVEHHAALYRDLADPVALLRQGRGQGALSAYWPYAGAPVPGAIDSPEVAAYSALMSASQPLVSDQILDAYPVARHRCLLDVGGGEGLFLLAAAARAPHLKLMLFDLPPVAERARRNFEQRGLADRAQAVGGDFRRGPLPRGADLVSLVRVVHDHDDEVAVQLLRDLRSAAEPGTTLLLAEPMAGTPGAERMGDAYFGLYLLAMGSGRPRTQAELETMLRSTGWRDVRSVATAMPLQTGLLVARAAS